MAESAEDLYARIVATVGEDGRVPMSPVGEWDMFPWEVVDGQLVPKVVRPPADEPLREGTGGEGCRTCAGEAGVRIWESWKFHVTRPQAPGGLPLVLQLQSNDHYDFTEMSDEEAAEFGQLSVWLSRIMSRLPGVGRVHVYRVGDGAEHLHVWFIARPERIPGIIGSTALEWDDMLPPVPEDLWLEDCRTVATKLANHGGRSLV